jgi:altronate dehydratase
MEAQNSTECSIGEREGGLSWVDEEALPEKTRHGTRKEHGVFRTEAKLETRGGVKKDEAAEVPVKIASAC